MLVFVYNAKNDFVSKTLDFAHKIISPNTYQCDLCSLTYGKFGIKKEWENYLKSIKYPHQFMYVNEFKKSFPQVEQSLPAIFWQQNKELKVIFSTNDFTQIQSVNQLILQLHDRLKTLP